MFKRLRFLLNRLGERLWVKPLLMCAISLAAVFAIRLVDDVAIAAKLPTVSLESVVTLLTILSSSMMVIATLAVASMVSSYQSASTTATPRSFPLVVADDLSQFALSTFIAAFIFSVTALVVSQNNFFGEAALFVLLVATLAFFVVVVLTFVRWVDGIARLGLLGNTIDKVEAVTARALRRSAEQPTMGGIEADDDPTGVDLHSRDVGYVQLVDMESLQQCGASAGVRITLLSLPGRLIVPGRPLARVSALTAESAAIRGDELERLRETVAGAIVLGKERTFDEDPRYGLVALTQIACRALSPAINDPGTAIDIIASMVRLLSPWCRQRKAVDQREVEAIYPNVAVPRLEIGDLLEDAFTALGRDSAGNVEVAVRIQVALASLAEVGDSSVAEAVAHHRELALKRAEERMALAADVVAVRRAVGRADQG